jgi:hypothetical protein
MNDPTPGFPEGPYFARAAISRGPLFTKGPFFPRAASDIDLSDVDLRDNGAYVKRALHGKKWEKWPLTPPRKTTPLPWFVDDNARNGVVTRAQVRLLQESTLEKSREPRPHRDFAKASTYAPKAIPGRRNFRCPTKLAANPSNLGNFLTGRQNNSKPPAE